MTHGTIPRWHRLRTEETRRVEEELRKEFPCSDAYRYNSASIRVRVIDPRFESQSVEARDDMVEPLLARLPESTQADIMNLLMLAPSEIEHGSRWQLANAEFDDPSPSEL